MIYALITAPSIVGLVIDVAFMKAINKSAQIINDSSDIAKAAGRQYDELLSTGYLTRAVSKDDFIKAVKNAASSSGDEVTAGTIAKVNRILNANDIANANEVVHAGLRRLCQNNAEVCEQVVKQFAKNPDVLTRLSSSILLNKHLPRAFSDLYTKIPAKAGNILDYFGREGARVIDNLPGALKTFDNLNTPSKLGSQMENIIEEILTDSNKCRYFSDLADESASWGSKIFGTPHQFLNSPGHGYTSYHQAFEMAQGKYKGFTYKEIHINQAVNINGINKKPDVWGIRANGKVDLFEVPHAGDQIEDLIDKLDEIAYKLGDKAGKTEIIGRID